MSDNEPARRSLLRQEGSDLSDTSTAINSPQFPHQRHGYHRMTSQGSAEFQPDRAPNLSASCTDDDDNVYGLGITARAVPISRVPVGSRSTIVPASPSKTLSPSTSAVNSPNTPQTPGSSKALLSPAPAWQRYDSGTYTFGGGLSLPADEQDGAKSKSPYNDSLEIAYTEEHTPRSINDNDDNDNDKNGRFESLPTIRLLTLKPYSKDAQRVTIYTLPEPVGCRFRS
jgi:hypothetical protein